MTEAGATQKKPRRRRGSREDTENELLDATLRLLERDGVLAGITLREVAQEAGVNHGQIYQYFGSRQMLLRAAISRLVDQNRLDPDEHWSLPFSDRRRVMWQRARQHPDFVKLEALLALDGDPDFTLFPLLDRTRAALDRDKDTGALPQGADGEVMHALTAATYLGYGIFRDTIARDLGISLDELDERAGAVFDQILDGLQNADTPARTSDRATTPRAGK
ncbi:TetR/AcrR family transcriptional regulator [Rhodococcus sp. IEGM 1305]|uniref:TetR/AcrR family transcriptional regulator n=1 Tax=Rhodococcus sp. IEGM 1305 TaxID=3047092 RepID=UPI0024B72497|nr:TetR/AcrR family transcriptional regulator [Rhodococcus sp. IEGM 1305]MDI9948505.1 TetR/AcrR family transcriptional regulator [Rhodococcus sp. IEGM 1305]